MSWAQNTKFRFQVFALMMMFVAPGFLISMAGETKRQMESAKWPSVPGEVQELVAKNWWDDESKTTKYFGRVSYRYTVDGTEYTSDLTDLGPGLKRADQNAAMADVSQYQPGMKVTVYYDPADPSIAIIENGIPSIHLTLIIGLIAATIVCSVISFFSVRGWLKGKNQSETETQTDSSI